MAIINYVLSELDMEAASTIRILERVPDDKLGWAPHERSMTLGRLASHIAAIPSIVEKRLRDGFLDMGSARPSTEDPGSSAAIVQRFRDNLAAATEYLRGLSDEELKQDFHLRRGDTVLRTFPKIGVVRNILLNHSYHHRGQLSVYLRLLDVPVPAIYGTSADENPFA
ncbi:MAG: DinB family protein [Acidobacteria bacterium]|nr:DinB family protein [Acidobacteriota bacterium]MBV9478800.1 DinB family protein [Acidobacteriota bacterium]